MAAGDRLLTSTGDRILDASGNRMLDDGIGNACCCGPAGTACAYCPGGSAVVPDTITLVVSSAIALDSGTCYAVIVGASWYSLKPTSASLTGTFTLTRQADVGASCVWSFTESNTTRATGYLAFGAPICDPGTEAQCDMVVRVAVSTSGISASIAFLVASTRSWSAFNHATLALPDSACVNKSGLANEQTVFGGGGFSPSTVGKNGTVSISQ